ncbi:response regulator [Belnapia sp. F-4-1]|uniref:response regulator n=1 Tax=Belnapia sp. F-4-1 TaxID=1545443 RepID=UPI00068F8428|nr:response regulator [Belnapia sp. F-4-1]
MRGPAYRRLRILVAEDEALIGLAVEQELEERGHAVTMASDGQAALELEARLGPFDVVVTDMQMPRMRGDELVQALRRRWPGLPVVVMSANHVPEASAALRALGGPITILTKPTPFGHLADEVERLEREA